VNEILYSANHIPEVIVCRFGGISPL